MATTVCPSRLLAEPEGMEAEDVMRWWLQSSPLDPMSGLPTGPPEWPRAGGMLNQPAKLVDAVSFLRVEIGYVSTGDKGRRGERNEQQA